MPYRPQTAAIQRACNELGHDCGPIDGKFGGLTAAGVESWLAARGEPRASSEEMPPAGWDERSARNLRGVHADLVRVMDRARTLSPVPFIVIEGLRTVERQRQLVAQGASRTMNSRHITGHAVDIVPLRPDGQPAFDWPLYHRLAPAVKQAAQDLGVRIVWGGDWRSFKDGPHFELDRNVYP